MKVKFSKKILSIVIMVALVFSLTACNTYDYEATDTLIIESADLSDYINKEGITIVDTRPAEDYAKGHVEGAVNIPISDLLMSLPVDGMLTSPKKMSTIMTSNGIGDDTIVVAYDDNKMGASRIVWSMMVYGNNNGRVVNGGWASIQVDGLSITSDLPTITPSSDYTVTDKKSPELYATIKDVQAIVNEPNENVILLDVRSQEEYLEKGKLPSSIMYNYLENFYTDNSFKSSQSTQINYLKKGIDPQKEIIIYCQTSLRAAPVFIQLYDAGYRNIKIYDGAFLEWTSNSNNPVEYADNSKPIVTDINAS